MSTRQPVLEVRALRKSFGGVVAVDGCSLAVQPNTITALIGPNGSGKTTVFNLITGMIRSDSGEVWLSGERIDALTASQRVYKGVARTFQITRLFRQMTVLENVVAPLRSFSWRQLLSSAVSGHERERAEEMLQVVGMAEFINRRAGELSYGQQKLVELAQILTLDPAVILLDEPAAGINPVLVERMAAIVRRLHAEGKSFLVVEHNMPFVMDLCDPVLVLARGVLISQGPPGVVQEDAAVLEAYLGA